MTKALLKLEDELLWELAYGCYDVDAYNQSTASDPVFFFDAPKYKRIELSPVDIMRTECVSSYHEMVDV